MQMAAKEYEILEKLEYMFGCDMGYDVLVYDIASHGLRRDIQVSYGLRDNLDSMESYIELFSDTDNEIRIYDHELELVFYRDNMFVMRYKDYFIICVSRVSDFISTLMKRRNEDVIYKVDFDYKP